MTTTISPYRMSGKEFQNTSRAAKSAEKTKQYEKPPIDLEKEIKVAHEDIDYRAANGGVAATYSTQDKNVAHQVAEILSKQGYEVEIKKLSYMEKWHVNISWQHLL